MKTDVYSWRVAARLKADLEREARRRNMSVSAILDLAAREWLDKSAANGESEEEQQRLRRAALKYVGAFSGGNPTRAENASQAVRQRLRQRHGR